MYDVSASATWPQGKHASCNVSSTAGRDLSAEILLAPRRMRTLLETMPVVGRLAPPRRWLRSLVQWALAAVSLLVLAVPFIAMGLRGFSVPPAVFAALRTLALTAFSLLFINAVIGAYRPLLSRVYRGSRLQTLHAAVGVSAFTLALAHGILLLSQGIAGYPWQVLFGPSVLVLLVAVIATALSRRSLQHVWRWVHRLNYVLFGLVIAHAFVVGYNLITQPFMKVIFLVYAGVVAAGLGYRVSQLVQRTKAARPSCHGS